MSTTDTTTTVLTEDDVLTSAEAAQVLRMTVEWVRRQCKAGQIPAVKFGRDWRITRGALTAFVNGTGTVPSPRQDKKKLSARQQRRT